MGRLDGVLLVSDLDDTYLPESGVVPAANREAVERFKAQGGIFTIATGRSRRAFAPQLPGTPVNAPVVLSNGAQLYDFAAGELLLEWTLPRRAGEELAWLADAFPQVGVEVYQGEEIYLWHPEKWTRHHIRKTGCSGEERPLRELAGPWSKVIFHQEHDVLVAVRARLLERWGEAYEAIFSNLHMLEITAKGCTKGGMVTQLAQRLGIRRENIYCAGDNENDLPMLAVSAVPFAPGDCSEAVKRWGAVLLPPCDSGAIAGAVEQIEARYGG